MYPGSNMMWMALGWAIGLAVIVVAFWSLLIFVDGLKGPKIESPQKTLKQRLAKGEIDIDEYAKRLDALSKTKRAA